MVSVSQLAPDTCSEDLVSWQESGDGGERRQHQHPVFMVLKSIGESLEKVTKMQVPGLQLQ